MGLLNNLRFPLSIIVVGIHVFSLTETYHPGSESVHVVKSIFDCFLAPIAVPCFFFISGYFFFLNYENSWNSYKEKIRKRIYRLLIPYIIWNILVLIKLCLYFGWETASFTPTSILNVFWDRNISPFGNGLESNILYPLNIPLWYIRDLMICVVVTPIVFLVVKRISWLSLYALFALFMVLTLSDTYQAQFANSLCLFCWGGYFSILKKKLPVENNILFGIFVVSFLLLGSLKMFGLLYLIPFLLGDKILIILGILILMNLSNKFQLREKYMSSVFVRSTYFVFLSHYLFYHESFKIIYKVIPQTFLLDAITYILGIVFTYIVSVTIYRLMEIFCRPILQILVGSYNSYGKH